MALKHGVTRAALALQVGNLWADVKWMVPTNSTHIVHGVGYEIKILELTNGGGLESQQTDSIATPLKLVDCGLYPNSCNVKRCSPKAAGSAKAMRSLTIPFENRSNDHWLAM
ncbi:hypothetical protein GGI26_003463 [Coemansia sp. RSA 1358]|uniref:Uncharacterized protein n=1 Tax=Coemansia umbellata TaxID=1424467 RepID=A0ABQ8PJE2_9FUNG|nr:hypothetical protein EDC05_004291 [Coemansia umbellata]KAJ2622168.1 hypothetical protein GGI26_003463 [Coemansia sp. RSA 1358]